MRRTTRRCCAAAVAALALAGCRAGEGERADRRQERAGAATAAPQADADLGALEGEADAIEAELDEIDALLTEG